MPATVVIGATWGDEGKGKVIDALVANSDVEAVARYQGGPNAGHSVEYKGRIYVLHSVPSGIFHSRVKNVTGNGCVVSAESLCEEMNMLKGAGLSLDNFYISDRAHLILPYQRDLDKSSKNSKAIGTTGRGIGPTYSTKAQRTGIRFADLAHRGEAREKVERIYCDFLQMLDPETRAHFECDASYSPFNVTRDLLNFYEAIKPHVTDTGALLRELLRDGARIALEGGQGMLLDVDHGTYPFVSSSNAGAGGADSGTGISPMDIDRIIGVAKAAYDTRVGNGPFPTEQGAEAQIALEEKHARITVDSDDFALLQELVRADMATDYEWGLYHRVKGREYGATTGRPRRVGFMDLVALRYSIAANGITDLALTKIDVSDELPRIPVCNQYFNGHETVKDKLPTDLKNWQAGREFVPGWQKSSVNAHTFEELPDGARHYIRWLERQTETQVKILSNGPGGDHTLFL